MTGVLVIRRQDEILERFREAGAITSDRASSFRDLGLRDWGFPKSSLVGRKVLRRVGEGTDGEALFYLDEARAERFIARRNSKVWVLIAAMVPVAIVTLFVMIAL